MNFLNDKTRQYVGAMVIAGFFLYVLTVTIGGYFTPDYQSSKQLISEIGQIHAPFASSMRYMLIAVGTLVCLLSVTLHYSIQNGSLLGSILITTVGLGLVFGGIFQCDPSCKPVTFHGWMHILTSIPATLSAIIIPFVFSKRFEQDSKWFRIAKPSTMIGWTSIVLLLASLTVFPVCGIPGFGQRISTFLQMIWFSMTAFTLLRFSDERIQNHTKSTSLQIRPNKSNWPDGPKGFDAIRALGIRRDLLRFTEKSFSDHPGICGITFGNIKICLISDPQYIEQVFLKHASRTKKWAPGQFEPLFGKGILTSSGELWKKQRSIIQPAFLQPQLNHYFSPMIRHVQDMLNQWKTLDSASLSKMDIHHEMLNVTLNIAASALFGSDTDELIDAIKETQESLMSHFENAVGSIPIPLYIPTPKNRKAMAAIRSLDKVVLDLITKRKAKNATLTYDERQTAKDFLGVLLAVQERQVTGTNHFNHTAIMDDKQLRDECMTMFLAGHESTALTLTWIAWQLSMNPEIEQNLTDELDRTFGFGPIDPAKLPELSYTKAVVDEALRLYPPVWAIARIATEDLDFGEYVLPKNTQIISFPYYVQRDKRYFNDPLTFRPERWLDPTIKQIPKCAYIPFGAGIRKCVGTQFAMQELILTTAQIFRSFTFESTSDTDVMFKPSVTLRPLKPVYLKAKRRNEIFAPL